MKKLIYLFFCLVLIFKASISLHAQNILATEIKEPKKESTDTQQFTSDPNDNVFYKFRTIDSVEYSLSTPYHTLQTLLSNLEPEHYNPKVASQVFSSGLNDLEQRIDLAIKLKLILSQKGIYMSGEDISMQKDYLDPKTETHRYVISNKVKGIYLEKHPNGNWLFSRYSTTLVPKLFQKTFPSYTGKLVLYTLTFQEIKTKYFGLKAWQWIGIGILTLVSYIIYLVGKWVIKISLTQFFSHLNEIQLQELVFPKLRKPLVYILITVMWYFMLSFLLFPANVTYTIHIILKLVFSFFTINFLFHLADLLVIRLGLYSSKSKKVDLNLLPVLKVVFKITFVVIGILFGLSIFGYDITNLLAGISFGGIALAFAAQDTIKNFFGSIMIFADKPFIVGDWVYIDGKEGVVEEIGFRTTRIRTFSNSLLNIPNGNLVTTDIDNYGKRQYRRFNTYLSVPYSTAPEKITLFIDEINKVLKTKKDIRQDFHEVRLNKMSSSSFDILLYVFFLSSTWSDELKAREDLLLEIIGISKRIGVEFAYPAQKIYTEHGDQDKMFNVLEGNK